MAFTKVDIARLKSVLLQAKLQSTNPPLYQVINTFINNMEQMQNGLFAALNEITAAASTTSNMVISGPLGMSGIDGSDGADSFFPGPIGPRGLPGTPGIPGLDGISCSDECSCMPFVGNIIS